MNTAHTSNKTPAETLKSIKAELGLTDEAAAHRIGISLSRMRKALKGPPKLHPDTLVEWAIKLGYEVTPKYPYRRIK